MAEVLSSSFNLVDSAIGPLGVQKTIFKNFDIDDYVHSTVVAQALQLQLINAAAKANPTLAKDRPPIDIEGTSSGGF